ncbi:HNH endonuclease signature motif containing protein [Pseudonocardia parietis]|uniref:DUF222 domain-containing protein n=1 Tax=Pseudonocardia parietis TaxID=570936 RepID=A0ABS4VNS4_9PSEU|nr:HNH endonuclease signature motif containing protein [Pseudonocardia parietis]MBP2365408.1 hypothetical protein [Pseudonocardia parietis]
MEIGQVVPEGLAAMLPGPDLAVMLAGLDLTLVPNDDIGDVLVAQSRQLAHEQARLFATMTEVVYRRPFAGPLEVRRGEVPELYGADEIRAALAWTRRAAESESDLAIVLVEQLPQVQTALWQGRIDRAKARVFAQHLAELPVDQSDAVCAAVLPHAPRLTTGQIAERIKRLILELDPAYHEHRYRKAIRDRQVVAYLSADGTAVITAGGLPADEAAAAWERLDALARAARHDGHPGTLDQVRADLVLGLLDGSLHGLDRAGILQALLERFAAHADPDTTGTSGTGTTGTGTTGPGTTGTGAEPGTTETGTTGTDIDRPAPHEPDPEPGGPHPEPGGSDPEPGGRDPEPGGRDPEPGGRDPEPGGPDPGGPPSGGRHADDRDTRETEADSGTALARAAATADPAGTPEPPTTTPPNRGDSAGVGVEVRVPLSTLLGLDDRAGELPGWGPVPAPTARRIVARQARAQWRWVVVDDHGHLLAEGITRHRPMPRDPGGPSGGVVELQIPETLLATLAATATRHGRWAAVITDIADRYRQHRQQTEPGADLDADPTARFPSAPLRRHTEVRDRTCVGTGCRTSARRCDQDHTVDHSCGGTSTRDGLGPLCRHDHMLKTVGGWQLDQPEPGHFIWTSPLGRVYPRHPEPILPPPISRVHRDPDPWFDDPPPDTDDIDPDLRRRGRAPPQEHLAPSQDAAPTDIAPDGDPRDDPPPF